MAEEKHDIKVIFTKAGNKYHQDTDCPWFRSMRRLTPVINRGIIYRSSIAVAETRGKKPCWGCMSDEN